MCQLVVPSLQKRADVPSAALEAALDTAKVLQIPNEFSGCVLSDLSRRWCWGVDEFVDGGRVGSAGEGFGRHCLAWGA
jgi:hypothetical protein